MIPRADLREESDRRGRLMGLRSLSARVVCACRIDKKGAEMRQIYNKYRHIRSSLCAGRKSMFSRACIIGGSKKVW